jgi:hypothetical protein
MRAQVEYAVRYEKVQILIRARLHEKSIVGEREPVLKEASI